MPFIIKNGKYYGSSGDNIVKPVEITQEEYDALGDVVNSNNTTYYITDADDDQYNASSVVFDDTNTQLGAVNVQGAIEKTNDAINELNSKLAPDISSRILLIEGTDNTTRSITIDEDCFIAASVKNNASVTTENDMALFYSEYTATILFPPIFVRKGTILKTKMFTGCKLYKYPLF